MKPFSLLNRCLFRDMSAAFLLCVVSLLTLVLVTRGLRMQDLFLGLDIDLADGLLLFLYLSPMFMLMVLPVSCMIAIFLTFLRMSTDRELIALRAGGIGIGSMLGGPAFFSLLCAALTLFVSLHALPWGVDMFRGTLLHLANTKAKVVLQPGVFNQDLFGLTLYARQVDPRTGHLRQVIFEDTTQGRGTSITVLASGGDIVTDAAKRSLVFSLEKGRLYRVDGDSISVLNFGEYTVSLDLDRLLKGGELEDLRLKEMSWAQLTAEENVPDASKRTKLRVNAEKQKRLALPVACLVLGLFAVPLGCAFEGMRQQLGLVLALIMFMVYYGLFSLGVALGEGGRLPPVAALWMSNIIFALAAGGGIRLISREKLPDLDALTFGLGRRLRRWFSRKGGEGRA